MNRVLIALGLCLLTAPASAQVNTECSTDYFGVTRCQTTGQPNGGGANWGILQNSINQPNVGQRFMEGYEQGQRIRAQREQQRLIEQQRRAFAQQQAEQQASLQAQLQEESEERSLKQRLGQMVASGDCPGAIRAALAAGNFGLANEVQDYCAKEP